MQNINVSILGCGNGGMALAADLKRKGAKVALWSHHSHADKFNKILQNNAEIILTDELEITVKLDMVSLNLSEVVNFGDIIYNCLPMAAHTDIFSQIIACLKKNTDREKYIINLSGVFSAIDQYLTLEKSSLPSHIKIYDTSSFPYACRAGSQNDVTILGRKKELQIAALFPKDHDTLNKIPESAKPTHFKLIENSLKLGLQGTNAVSHPARVLFNARLIENGSEFLFYREGTSKQTSLLLHAMDEERLLLAKTMGYNLISSVEEANVAYGTQFKDSYDFSINSSVHKTVKAPTTLAHRFITEDVPYGLVPLITLAKLYGLQLPNIESVITLFSTIMGVDYKKYGRHLQSLTRQTINELS